MQHIEPSPVPRGTASTPEAPADGRGFPARVTRGRGSRGKASPIRPSGTFPRAAGEGFGMQHIEPSPVPRGTASTPEAPADGRGFPARVTRGRGSRGKASPIRPSGTFPRAAGEGFGMQHIEPSPVPRGTASTPEAPAVGRGFPARVTRGRGSRGKASPIRPSGTFPRGTGEGFEVWPTEPSPVPRGKVPTGGWGKPCAEAHVMPPVTAT